jgi:hypothetical protein
MAMAMDAQGQSPAVITLPGLASPRFIGLARREFDWFGSGSIGLACVPDRLELASLTPAK